MRTINLLGISESPRLSSTDYVVRDVDIENARSLKQMREITVLESISEIEGVVRRHIEGIS